MIRINEIFKKVFRGNKKKALWCIHELTPAPYGDHYRLVESFDDRIAAEKVLSVLESVNFGFKYYKIVDWAEPSNGKMLPV
jgi:hypothetical protein